jgi:hypothetical protein
MALIGADRAPMRRNLPLPFEFGTRMLRSLSLAVLIAGLVAGCQSHGPPAPQTYLLFFTQDSTELSPDARKVVDQAAAGIAKAKPSTVQIAGYADEPGTPAYNLHVSEKRIAAVETALVADGVAPGTILRIPLGDQDPTIGGTGDRRIEIRFISGG